MPRKKNNKLFLDLGNWDVKFVTASGDPQFFRHALAPIQDSYYQELTDGKRNLPPEGIVCVNGVPYAYGDTARRYRQVQKIGAQRYQSDYFGVLMATALGLAYEYSSDNVFLFATHAPRDLRHRRDIRGAAAGEWHVITHERENTFRIDGGSGIATMDEPLGGLNHYMLTDSGNERRVPMRDETILVIDVGGLTTDVVPVDPGGRIDVSAMGSSEIGAMQIYRHFEQAVRARYHEEFRNTTVIDRARLEQFLLSGEWNYGTKQLDVERQAQEAINLVMNDISDLIKQYGGMTNYDGFLLTGGGAVLIEHAMLEFFPYARIELAEKNRANMRYANVLGTRKFARLAENEGIL